MSALSRERCAWHRIVLPAALAVSTILAGCAQFPGEHPGVWKDQPSLQPQAGPQPSIEGEAKPPPSDDPKKPAPSPPPPGGCKDPDKSVVATCLDPVGALTVLPDGQSALVGEKFTGKVLRVQRGSDPVEVARIPVDPSGGGGLTALALSPSYQEDELFYAYATTPSGTQVLRIAPGDRPKPIITGLPKGSSGNSGALLTDRRGGLLVATGNGGSPAKVDDGASLAGKVLRVDGFGKPAPDNPNPASPVVASGLASPGGLCGSPDGASLWVTDQGTTQDALYRVTPGRPLGSPAWSWPDRPGVSGCVANQAVVVVAQTNASALFMLHPGPEGTFTGQPSKVLENTYGRLSASALGEDGLLWLGTSNKAGGRPVPSDDRVIKIEPPSGGTAGKD